MKKKKEPTEKGECEKNKGNIWKDEIGIFLIRQEGIFRYPLIKKYKRSACLL